MCWLPRVDRLRRPTPGYGDTTPWAFGNEPSRNLKFFGGWPNLNAVVPAAVRKPAAFTGRRALDCGEPKRRQPNAMITPVFDHFLHGFQECLGRSFSRPGVGLRNEGLLLVMPPELVGFSFGKVPSLAWYFAVEELISNGSEVSSLEHIGPNRICRKFQ